MSILSQWLGLSEDTNDMAGRAASPINTAKINAYVQQLKLAVRDKSAFDRIYSAIDSDKCLSAAELVAVAQGFAGAGR